MVVESMSVSLKLLKARSSRVLICTGAVLLSLGCRDLTGARAVPSLTGNWSWVSGGVDFFAGFELKQDGTVITGQMVYMYGSGVDSTAVQGTVNGRQAMLQWQDTFFTPSRHVVLNARLSLDGQTMTATESIDGAPPVAVAPLRRYELEN